MDALERLLIDGLLHITSADQINTVLSNPAMVAILVGGLVAISTAVLGVFLLLRGMSLTADAISHTVLLGIVVAFLVMVYGFSQEPDLSSPWLIVGAAMAGVATVVLTELIQRSGLVKADAALGLVFPLLFAVAVILINRHTENVHLDTDAVLFGEIGAAWANTNSYCYDRCETVTITPDDPRAQTARRCVNCAEARITPRDPRAVFEEVCGNCGTYSAAEAWRVRLIPEPPVLVFWPRALTVTGLTTLINLLFVVVFYKELKLAAFDPALAKALRLRPGVLHYGLMILVSVTAVAAFDAVGSILVVAFFVIPAAAAYLLTDRLSVMLALAPLIGGLAAYTGYDLARGYFLGLEMDRLLVWLDSTVGLGGVTRWNTSISAAMVIMTFCFFVLAWVASPRYGLISTLVQRRAQRRAFADQLLMGHILNHQGRADARDELAPETLHAHLNWTPAQVRRHLIRLRAMSLVRLADDMAVLTPRGEARVRQFMAETLARHGPRQGDAHG